jgi:hypothetical protein
MPRHSEERRCDKADRKTLSFISPGQANGKNFYRLLLTVGEVRA